MMTQFLTYVAIYYALGAFFLIFCSGAKFRERMRGHWQALLEEAPPIAGLAAFITWTLWPARPLFVLSRALFNVVLR